MTEAVCQHDAWFPFQQEQDIIPLETARQRRSRQQPLPKNFYGFGEFIPAQKFGEDDLVEISDPLNKAGVLACHQEALGNNDRSRDKKEKVSASENLRRRLDLNESVNVKPKGSKIKKQGKHNKSVLVPKEKSAPKSKPSLSRGPSTNYLRRLTCEVEHVSNNNTCPSPTQPSSNYLRRLTCEVEHVLNNNTCPSPTQPNRKVSCKNTSPYLPADSPVMSERRKKISRPKSATMQKRSGASTTVRPTPPLLRTKSTGITLCGIV